ncbi:hypothetical protein BG015_002650 [Linnemannia schmuckeri]|uniref:Potassium channel domain-containing protein n=1 Tax=Linnemannia schmuckeri TaxID=64567 RepID=A0A9P5S2Y2_9FUNG|nr:hypothetical protein BG015_002650 [Linnemannia schmuckeri]
MFQTYLSLTTPSIGDTNKKQSPAASNITSGSSKPLIRSILYEGHRLVDSADFGSEAYEDEKNDSRLCTSVSARQGLHSSNSNNSNKNKKVARQGPDNTALRGGGGAGLDPPESSANSTSTISPDPTLGPPVDVNQPRPRLAQVGPHIVIATIQSYNILTVVRAVADPSWMVLKSSDDKLGEDDSDHLGYIDKFEIIFLALAIICAFLSCIGFTLRIMDRLTWIRKAPVVTAYLQMHYHIYHKLPPGAQYSHGFITCILTIILSCLVTILLTIDWVRGFPSPGLSIALKELIISSFVMTTAITIGAATELSAVGYFIVALRNAVLEQFQWRLLERFSKPAHITRVQTRMSTKDMSFPLARFEEEQRVKKIFVTLTTVGFGDMVPTEPGSIEFWNIYVFLGLTVFAYILSMFSDTMASQIHLVDDGEGDEDDEGMYGWEQCEDPNYQFSGWNGTLGLEGLKWAQKQQLFRFNQGQDIAVDIGRQGSPMPGQQAQNDRPKGLQRVRFWTNGGRGGGASVGPLEGQSSFQHPLDGIDQQPQKQSQQPQRQRARLKSQQQGSASRILMVPAKERKQMLEAEYYATHGGPPADPININPAATAAGSTTAYRTGAPATATTPGNTTGGGGAMMMTGPATIKFEDKFRSPHQRVIGRRMRYIPEDVQASQLATFTESGPAAATAESNTAAASNATTTTTIPSGDHLGDQQQHQQGYTYSTTGYYDALAKRRGSLAAIYQIHDHKHRPNTSHIYGHDGGQAQGRPSTPMQDQYRHYDEANTIQTDALEHQPTVRFESPSTRSWNGGGSTLQQQQQSWQRQQQNQSQYQPQYQSQYQYHDHPLSTNPFDYSSSSNAMLALQSSSGNSGGGDLRIPWPIVDDNGNDYESSHDYHITAATSEAFARYLNLDHTRQSHSSDVTKVGSPPVDLDYLGQSPFFVDDDAIKKTSFSAQQQQQQQKKVGNGGGGASEVITAGATGMQTPPTSRPVTNTNRGNAYYGDVGGSGGGGDENDVGPMNETRNSEDLPAFAIDVNLNKKGATTTQTVGGVVPSSPQSPSLPRAAATQQQQQQSSSRMPPPPSSFKAKCSSSSNATQAPVVVDPNLEVGPFGEVRNPNRLLEFSDVDLNSLGSCARPKPSPFTSTFNNNNISNTSNSGGTGQHQATPENTNTRRSSRPPAEPVTLSSTSSSAPPCTDNNNIITMTTIPNNSSNSTSSINLRTTTPSAAIATTRSLPLPFLPPDTPPLVVGSFDESRQHPMAEGPFFPPSLSKTRSGTGAGKGQGISGVDLNRPGTQHQKATTTPPNPSQSSHPVFSTSTCDQGEGGSDGKSNNPFLLFSRRTSTGAAGGPLSLPTVNRASSRPLQQQSPTTSTNPFIRPQPQWSMSSSTGLEPPLSSPSLPPPPPRPHPPASSYSSSSPSTAQLQILCQNQSQSQNQSQGQVLDDRRGLFDEPKSQNTIPWLENNVDLNKSGPDPSQVDEAHRSIAEIERRTSAKEAESILQKRASSALALASSAFSVSSNKFATITTTARGGMSQP